MRRTTDQRGGRRARQGKGNILNANQPTVPWRTSSFCATAACVEVSKTDDTYLLRDSKDRDGAILRFTQDEWDAFVAGVTAGDFVFD